MFCDGLSSSCNLRSKLALGKTHKKTCFAVGYRICAISSQSSHLLKSDFPSQNTQKDVFSCGIFNIVRVQVKVRVDSCKNRICIVKHSKRRVLRWVIAFVQLKVRLGTCTKLIFHSKTHKKTHF